MKKLLLSILIIFSINSFAQSSYRWKDHLSYKTTKDIIKFEDKLLLVSQYGLFFYDLNDNSIEKFSKLNGLTGEEISSTYYVEEHNLIIVGYLNGDFSIINSDFSVVNNSEIRNSNLPGHKEIRDIAYYNDKIYLASGFGIVEYNVARMEYGDSFFFGNSGSYISVNSISVSGNNLYAATDNGLYSADLDNQLLVDYRQWTLINDIPIGIYNSVAVIGDKVLANLIDPSIQQFYFDGSLWVNESNNADLKNFVVSEDHFISISNNYIEVFDLDKNKTNSYSAPSGVNWYANSAVLVGENIFISTDSKGMTSDLFPKEFIYPSGPQYNDGFRLNAYGKKLYLSYGGFNQIYTPIGRRVAPDLYKDGNWSSIPLSEIQNLKGIIDIVENPNNENDLFFVSYGSGVVNKTEEGSVLYNNENSGLDKLIYLPDPNYVSIRPGGGKFDIDGNIWFANGWNIPNTFVVFTKDKKWYKYNTFSEGMYNDYGMSKLVIDEYGNKWVGTSNAGLWVFNENNTIENTGDDLKLKFTTEESKGALPSIDVRTVAVDKDNNVWIGTTRGLVMFNDVDNLGSTSTYSAKPIIIEENGVGQKLLGDLFVSKIVVDGANNKWFATLNAGVYYTNYNGQKTIYHFTKDNSPLLSNEVIDLDVDPETGEVYFLTNKGLISFQGEASEASSTFDNLIVYPNPVKPGYEGEIFIRGLGEKSNVKITDVNGNVIYETTSNGGLATWNGLALDGAKVGSGVYFIFALSSDGQQSKIAKLLIVR